MAKPNDNVEESTISIRRVHSLRLLSSLETKEEELGSQLRRGGSLRVTRTSSDRTESSIGDVATAFSDADENINRPIRPARPNRHSAPSTAAPAPEFLARSLLQLGCPVVSIPQPRGGVGSEHLPSSDSDDSSANQGHHTYGHGQVEGLGLPKVHVSGPPNSVDPATSLNGSAGSLGARSAPSTPLQNLVLQAGQPISGSQLGVSGSNQQLPPPRSPSHTALKCNESQLSKPLSRSTPSMAASVQTVKSRSSTRSSSSTSSARQKKFHRHFNQVPAEERVLNYYSCALVADILLQGHLYITPNYFGFYSNVFGYVTKLLVPTASVVKISKEKTARIIPNAVAIVTEKDRHVFCSLLSRDSTFNLMKQVLDAAKEQTPAADIPLPVQGKLLAPETLLVDDSEANLEVDDSSMSESGTDRTSRPPTACTYTEGFLTTFPRAVATTTRIESVLPVKTGLIVKPPIVQQSGYWAGFRPGTIIAILVALLAALYVSAALMMMRIDRLHAAYLNHPLASPERFTQDSLLKYLNSNLDQIVKVRQSLQTLSQQFVSMTEDNDAGPISGGVIDPEDAPS